MTHRRKVGVAALAVVLTVVLLLIAAVSVLWVTVHRTLTDAGIQQLNWHSARFSLSGLELGTVSFALVQPERRIGFDASSVTLSWRWQGLGLQLDNLEVERLRIGWKGALFQARSAGDGTYPLIRPPQSGAFWLPRRLNIADLHAALPCRTGTCELEGALELTRAESVFPLEAQVRLEGAGREDVLVSARVDDRTSAGSALNLTLDAAVSAEKVDYLAVDSRYVFDPNTGEVQWSGTVQTPTLPDVSAVAAWIGQWQTLPKDFPGTQPQPEAARLSAGWSMRGQASGGRWRPADGKLGLTAVIAEPWTLPKFGTGEGELALTLALGSGHWRVDGAQADLRLSELGTWAGAMPAPFRPRQLLVRVRPGQENVGDSDSGNTPKTAAEGVRRDRLPLEVSVGGNGPTRFDLTTEIALPLSSPWQTRIADLRMSMELPNLEAGGWHFRGVRAHLRGEGAASPDGFSLSLATGASLQVDYVDNPEKASPFWADGLRADLARTRLSADFSAASGGVDSLRLTGPARIDAVRLRHSILKTQPWHFLGEVDLGLNHLALDGVLAAESGAKSDLSLNYRFGEVFTLDGALELAGTNASQVLAGTFTHWPAQLLFDSGRISAGVNVRLGGDTATALTGQVGFAGMEGLFNRIPWAGLDGGLAFTLHQDELYIQTDDVTLETINPGVPLTQLAADVAWRADVESLQGGILHLKHASADVLGGELRVEPGVWALGQSPMLVVFEIAGLDVSQLLKLYPAEGVSGTGELQGRVPVRLGQSSLSIEGGEVWAAEPGGTLKLPAERFRGMLPDNPAMELVADAVKNFHYSVLKSSVDYDDTDQLLLDVRLEGQNPAVRNGYPLVLNINLEEDVSALLASLRLSGELSRAVTERVQQKVDGKRSQKQQ